MFRFVHPSKFSTSAEARIADTPMNRREHYSVDICHEGECAWYELVFLYRISSKVWADPSLPPLLGGAGQKLDIVIVEAGSERYK